MMSKTDDDKPTKRSSKKAAKAAGSGDWSTAARIGAAVGSAAIAAALIYAGRHKVKTLDDFAAAKPKKGQRYEFEPEDDDDHSDEAGA
jgi:hypothetical protein